MGKIAVLGSVNMDIVITTGRMPKVGETIIGDQIDYFVGGKGANQAVAAARFGGKTTFLGKIGQDTFGEKVYQHLSEEQLDVRSVAQEKNIFTGIASIFKLPQDNCITVISGANELVDREYVDQVAHQIIESDVLLVQIEIPVETLQYALQLAKENGVTTLLNPAPYHDIVGELLPNVDILTPNETEFAALIGKELIPEAEMEETILAWQQTHTTRLIVTRGSQGVSFVESDKLVTVPSSKVPVVDTTGAGDTFNGILAAALSEGMSFKEAVILANRGAGLSVQKLGAQTGMPTRAAVIASEH
ncbi:ribokinase [Enterococcus gallinarum]|uniref:Ribokinase n=1 Tax=Enterococcus gallinarum TaxID=1353 RepID=A0A376H3E8_ENTGA|nr:ribokinase [Enterococcus gallinarum]OJG49450.1 ribokinase [Enterococcus gallinarum]STD84873.1 ribokinase [Enterococcus gallinarum]STD86979.1 ribokinase [Enterococcus gallinarum]